MTPATTLEFEAYLSKYALEVAEDNSVLLKRSLKEFNPLKLCNISDDEYVNIHCSIAYEMSVEGGSWKPSGVLDNRIQTKKGVGRSAILKEWEVNKTLSDSSLISQFMRNPAVFALIEPFLCSNANYMGRA